MSVHQPVGISTSFATSTTSAQSTAIAKKSNALRIVSVGADAHVAIGTFPVGTTTRHCRYRTCTAPPAGGADSRPYSSSENAILR